jgi:hypothetical protein
MKDLKNSTKKQQNAKSRGRPWPKGQSGNPGGRPIGAQNKITLAVLAGNRPLTLDKNKPFETWSDCYIQSGMRFRRDTLERINPKGPIPTRPERLDIREVRQEAKWKGRRYLSQRGWLFDPATHLPIKP